VIVPLLLAGAAVGLIALTRRSPTTDERLTWVADPQNPNAYFGFPEDRVGGYKPPVSGGRGRVARMLSRPPVRHVRG